VETREGSLMTKEWYEVRLDWEADVQKKAPFQRHGKTYTFWNRRTETWYTEGMARRMKGKYMYENIVRKLGELHSEDRMTFREASNLYMETKRDYTQKMAEFEAEHDRVMNRMERQEWWTREFWSPPR